MCCPTDEEAAILRTDENVRAWYAALKNLRQEAERELAEVRKRKKLTHRKDQCGTREEEIGLEIFHLNTALGEAKGLVKDLNVRETAAKAKAPPAALAPPPPKDASEALLRGDLRASRRLMRRCFDFLIDDGNVTFKAMEVRDGLVEDLRRELRGT
jgi:hypothetical protein